MDKITIFVAGVVVGSLGTILTLTIFGPLKVNVVRTRTISTRF